MLVYAEFFFHVLPSYKILCKVDSCHIFLILFLMKVSLVLLSLHINTHQVFPGGYYLKNIQL